MTRTVLIVEDTPEQRDIFTKYLQFVGARTIEATNGREGLEMAFAHRPDMILLDLAMPVMDGWEMLRRLRASPELAHIPVVAVTGQKDGREALAEAGVRGTLEKPLAPFRILEEVERCLGPFDDRAAALRAQRLNSRPGGPPV